jgi:hypothetical protein
VVLKELDQDPSVLQENSFLLTPRTVQLRDQFLGRSVAKRVAKWRVVESPDAKSMLNVIEKQETQVFAGNPLPQTRTLKNKTSDNGSRAWALEIALSTCDPTCHNSSRFVASTARTSGWKRVEKLRMSGTALRR